MNSEDKAESSDKNDSPLLPLILRFVDSDVRLVRVEILEELYKLLQNDRKDISSMIFALDKGRGFSENASVSTLHQFVIRLLEVSFSKGMSNCGYFRL